MLRFFFTIQLLFILWITPSLRAQIVLDPDYQLSAPQSGAKRPSSPGWGSSQGEFGAEDDSELDPTGSRKRNQFLPLDDSSSSGGGYQGFSGRFRPGRPNMTRQDVIRQKQEQAWREKMQEEEELQRLLFDFKVKSELQELFGEPERYIPKELRKKKAGSDENEASNQPENQASPSEPNPQNKQSDPANSNSEEDDAFISEDEQIDREAQAMRAELERLADSEDKSKQIEAWERREKARRQWRERRDKAEKGALFFNMDPRLKLREAQLREGWCRLFDGHTFFGWRPQTEGPYAGGRFFIDRGIIRSDPAHPGLLYTTCQFGDSTIMFEYQAEEDSEAFLLLRTAPNPKDLNSSCYAVVLNSADYQRPRGTILGRHQFSVEQLMELGKSRKDTSQTGQWRKLTAQFDGTSLQIVIDRDEPITLYDARPPGCGYIGLLVAKGDVRFRNMIWKPGSSLPLFDPVAPETHWRYNGDKIKLTATRTISMQLEGGPGVAETKESFDHFILQMEYNVPFTSARTGLFFRSTPREEMSGYEVSLQNFPTRKDRDTILGVDAGAFRNRKNARYTRPQDQKWNYLTLIVMDRHFQTWINGIPVCEMSDMRPIGENVEKGAVLQAGTLQLLAPTESSNFQFRDIRITPIAPRQDRSRSADQRNKMTWESMLNESREKEREEKLNQEMISGKGS